MKFLKKIFSRRRNTRPFCSALIPAAGSSTRMEGENKLLLPLNGMPVLARTLVALDQAKGVDELVIAAREEDLVRFGELCKLWGIQKPVRLIAGGATRAESVLRAATEADPDAALLAVHDGARPLATPELIDAVIEAARLNYAAAPAIPVKDTVKIARDGVVRSTPDRSTLFAVQTPQVFDAQLLRSALHDAAGAGAQLTDDCSAVERLGKEVRLITGSEENIKITTPLDMLLAEAILRKREG